MSKEYDLYLEQHKNAVRQALYWIMDNLPTLIPEENQLELVHQIGFAHDASKTDPEEYIPYDTYFYGGNRSHQVVEEYEYAWLIHIHNNPHHWQYWILHHDDPEEAETIMDMPYNYILEMICDWWSFSWKTGNLYEIFDWYDERKDYMKLSDKTQKIVENILEKIKWKLDDERGIIEHSGRPGMKWGVRNGPPYPIDKNLSVNSVENPSKRSKIKSTTIAKEKFTQYALNPEKAPDKAHAFSSALGYTLDNYEDLIKNINDNFDPDALEERGNNGYGMLYQQIMVLKGPNGKEANVCTAWIEENDGNSVKLTSAYVTKKEGTK